MLPTSLYAARAWDGAMCNIHSTEGSLALRFTVRNPAPPARWRCTGDARQQRRCDPQARLPLPALQLPQEVLRVLRRRRALLRDLQVSWQNRYRCWYNLNVACMR